MAFIPHSLGSFILLHVCLAGLPSNWRKYIHPDSIEKYRNVKTSSMYSSRYFQGDIAGVDLTLSESKLQSSLNAAVDAVEIWPNGIIPFEISDTFTFDQQEKIKLAMEMISLKTEKCITFLPRMDQEDYLAIKMPLQGCSSMVGRQGHSQTVMYTSACLREIGDIQHELLHALGLFHEISRPDRDKYVWVNLNNVEREFRHNFNMTFNFKTTGLPYDYQSIMHYPHNAFAINGALPTIVPKQLRTRIGLKTGMSNLDAKKVMRLYGCDKSGTRDAVKSTAPWETSPGPVQNLLVLPANTPTPTPTPAPTSMPKPTLFCRATVNPGDDCNNFSTGYGVYSPDRLREMNPSVTGCTLVVGMQLYIRNQQWCGKPCTPTLC